MPEDIMYFVTDMYNLKWLTGTSAEDTTDVWEEVPTDMTYIDAMNIANGLNAEEGFDRFGVGSHPKPV